MTHYTKSAISTFAFLSALVIAAPSNAGVAAVDYTIPSGCAQPTTVKGSNIYYVDPVHGSSKNAGTADSPWASLSDVTSRLAAKTYIEPYFTAGKNPGHNGATNPAPTDTKKYFIKGGDTILLMSGSYGDVYFTGVNDEFLTIEAAPGQTPVFHSLTVHGASHYIIHGVTVQNLAGDPSEYQGALVSLTTHDWVGTVDNIIFDSNTVDSQPDVSSWTQAQWLTQAARLGVLATGSCMTVSNNSIYNVRFGAGLFANNSIFYHNHIDNFGDDGLDYQASNIVISHNLITNNNNLGDGNHEDGMQGQIGNAAPNTNIVIDSNTVIRQTNPNLKFPTYLQGIDAFDDDWTNLVVSNNLVVTNAWHGISFGSTHKGLIVNNTVIADGTAPTVTTWITAGGRTHQGSASNNVIVRNNIATALVVGGPPGVVTADHNVVGGTLDMYNTAGKYEYLHGAKIDGTMQAGDNFVMKDSILSLFVGANPLSYEFNFNLLPDTVAVGTGNATYAPSLDLMGAKRTMPVDVGAYKYIASYQNNKSAR